jgi:hypothetical protein
MMSAVRNPGLATVVEEAYSDCFDMQHTVLKAPEHVARYSPFARHVLEMGRYQPESRPGPRHGHFHPLIGPKVTALFRLDVVGR